MNKNFIRKEALKVALQKFCFRKVLGNPTFKLANINNSSIFWDSNG